MNDKNFVKIFNNSKNIGVRNIIDFNTDYLNARDLFNLYFIIETIRRNPTLRKLLREPELFSHNHLRKFY